MKTRRIDISKVARLVRAIAAGLISALRFDLIDTDGAVQGRRRDSHKACITAPRPDGPASSRRLHRTHRRALSRAWYATRKQGC